MVHICKGLLEAAGKSHAGLAHVLDGDDAYLPGSDEKLSLRHMRGADLCDDGHSVQDVILYRVVVQEVGRPLWKYENLEQLVRAVKCAVEGHRTLCDVGVIHGDIGPGNIMIQTKTELKPWKTDSTGTTVYEVEHTFPSSSDTKGFLLGYEFASFPDLRTGAIQVPEDAFTGRFIFKASEVLMGIHHNTPVSITRSHDLQSFLWVILYVVYRRAVEAIPETREVEPMEHHERLRAEYNALFTVYGATDLLNSRAALFAKLYVHDMDASKLPAVCAGIQTLLLHGRGDDALRRLLETIWIILKECQPLNVAEEDVAYSDLLQALHSPAHCSEEAPFAPQPTDIWFDGDEQPLRKTHEGIPFTQGRSRDLHRLSVSHEVDLISAYERKQLNVGCCSHVFGIYGVEFNMQPSPLPNSSGAGFLPVIPNREDLGLQLADCTCREQPTHETVYRSQGTMPFTASEVLRGIAANAPFARNKSHDLQSFFWTIISIGYHSAIRAVEGKDESRPKSPAKIDRRDLREECHTLFPSTTPQGLADSRRAAFRCSTLGAPFAGIQYLFLYANAVNKIDGHPDQGLIFLVAGAWSILLNCEPEALVMPQDLPSSLLHFSLEDLSQLVMPALSAASAPKSAPPHGSGYRPSKASLTLNHEKLVQFLGEVLEAIPRACFQGLNKMADHPRDMGLDTDHGHCSADAR
ncbi:hypothetical protein NUW54_g271 [Trametes sanguinea]|uniref:Uncharacterized protein n=1 Tax=Trametes sanguinea TaxID=158606 RepID=A0ACC1QBH8_9APHY|nr:hypothetical protein NUW54_g271 [Trametes sanguinea]